MNYLPLLMQSIRTRLTGDTGTGGLFASGSPLLSGVFLTRAPEKQAFPFAVITLVDATADDAFRTKTDTVVFQVSVYVDLNSTSPLQRMSDILERIDGNWETVAYGTQPTYGLDRWRPTVTGWSPDIVTRERAMQMADTPDVLTFIAQYRVNISRVGV